jgi:hypothetical protein
VNTMMKVFFIVTYLRSQEENDVELEKNIPYHHLRAHPLRLISYIWGLRLSVFDERRKSISKFERRKSISKQDSVDLPKKVKLYNPKNNKRLKVFLPRLKSKAFKKSFR